MMNVHPILLLDLYPTDQRLLLHRCHTVFATVSWHYALKSGSMSPPSFVVLFQECFGYAESLALFIYENLGSTLQITHMLKHD